MTESVVLTKLQEGGIKLKKIIHYASSMFQETANWTTGIPKRPQVSLHMNGMEWWKGVFAHTIATQTGPDTNDYDGHKHCQR